MGGWRLSIEHEIFRNGKAGQPLAAVPLYGCRIPLAGKACARDYARRRVSERSRRKAALSAEMAQERKQVKRRQWRIKQACFEEVPRLADARRLETGWCDGAFLRDSNPKLSER